MSTTPKGSTPGPITARIALNRTASYCSERFIVPRFDEPLSRPPTFDRLPEGKCCNTSDQHLGRALFGARNDSFSKIDDVEGIAACHSGSTNDNGNELVTYPEGGTKAWLVVFGSFCAMLTAFGLMNTIGVFQAYLSENQLRQYDESSIGWIFSVYTFISFGAGIQIGPVFDAKGPRALIASGSVLCVTSMLLLGLCTQYWHFMLCFGLLGGVGTSLLFTPAISSIGHFFLAKRGNATGIAAAGGSVGGVVFPIFLQHVLPKLGFAWATRIMAFIFIALCIVANLLIRSRLAPKPGSSVLPDIRIFGDLSFLCTTLGVFAMEWGLFIPIAYLTSFSTTVLEDGNWGFILIAVLNAGSSIGRWAPGFVADKLGRFNCMLVMLTVCMLTTLGLWLPASLLPNPTTSNTSEIGVEKYHYTIKIITTVYAALFGIASGSNISLTPVCVGQLCDTANYGRYYATCYTVVSFGVLTGIPLAGALVRVCHGGYWGLVGFTGGCYLASVALFTVARWKRVGWKVGVVF
jgi:MFS family permease